MKNGKLLIYAIYPAPYRFEIIKKIAIEYNADVFFESDSGDDRNKDWFSKNDCNVISTTEGKKRFIDCKKEIKNYSLVVLFDFSGKESVKLILRCIFKKVPYIVNCDGAMLFKHGNFLKDVLKRVLIGNACAYFASGKHAREYLIKYGAEDEKIYYHNFTALFKKDILSAPVPVDQKAEIRKRLGLPPDKKICIAVGRFIPLKRYDVLLWIWKDMPKDVFLLLIGGGPEKQKYESIIKENGLKNVILDDFHPFDELLEYYKAADLFVHPTSYDVWGLIINEAMACGLPVVVTDTCVAGLELIKNGENGFVTKLGDDTGFAEKIRRVLSDDDRRSEMAINAIDTIRPFYMENMIDSQLKTIKKVLSENAK